MSPKTATISLALLSLVTLCLPLSSVAFAQGCPASSLSGVLQLYGLPGGLFPNNVQHLSCTPVSSSSSSSSSPANLLQALSISVRLQGACNVTREFFLIKNVVECKPEISAIISKRQLTKVTGVNVMVSFQKYPIGERMTISEVKVSDDPMWGLALQFFSAEGVNSPKFPIFLIPSTPPTCDRHQYASPRSVVSAAANNNNNNNQDVPYFARKYGSLLPLVA